MPGRGEQGSNGRGRVVVSGVLRELTTRDDLVAACPGDAFARWDPPDRLAAGFALDESVAYLRRSHSGRPTMNVWGPDIGPLLVRLRDGGVLSDLGAAWISVPRDQIEVLERTVSVRGGGEWDWMWTDTPPGPTSADDRLITLDDSTDAAEITNLLAENPRSEGYPGTGRAEVWLGIRDDGGALVSCGAVHRLDSGTAHLAGIHTAERARGRGLGRAVTAGLTRWVLAREPVVTLGMYADSAAARRVYHSLGFRTDKEWSSKILVRRGT